MKRKNVVVIKIVILSFVFLGLMPQVVLAQAFIYIIGIQGESQDRHHKNWIDVSSFSGSVPQPGATGTGSRGGPGQFHIVKRADRASAALNQACATGRSIPAVTLDVPRTDGKPGYIRENGTVLFFQEKTGRFYISINRTVPINDTCSPVTSSDASIIGISCFLSFSSTTTEAAVII